MNEQWLADDIADGHPRIQRAERILKDHLHLAAEGDQITIRDSHEIDGAAVVGEEHFARGWIDCSRMQRAAVVLPDPDSPTMPRISPGRTSKEMLSTALKISTFFRQPEPACVSKCFERFRTRRSGTSPVTRASGPCEVL